jgi:uncharacterized protein YndB with AHSA1/START domain
MTDRSAVHGMFTIERAYDASPRRVFDAFATAEGKERWFVAPSKEWTLLKRSFDFRIGGREQVTGRWASGLVSDFQAQYWDIIPGERIVYVYEMYQNGAKISVSLATLEFKPAGAGTRFVLTEQGVFLDGYDDAGSREHGTKALVDQMGASL